MNKGRRYKNRISLFITFMVLLCAPRLTAQTIPGTDSTERGFWTRWFERSDKAKEEQPHWITPLATTTPRLEQEFRYDVLWQQAMPGRNYSINYDNSKGLELMGFLRVGSKVDSLDDSFLISQEKQPESLQYFVAHSTECLELFLRRSFCGIVESPMDRFSTWKDWAVLFGAITHRNDVIKPLIQERFHVFRRLLMDVSTQFHHHFNATWMKSFRMSSSAEYFKLIASNLPKQSFRHLTPRGVSSA